jgi:predicted transporter
MTSKTEAILWSIALPGFAQILNKKLAKGFVFIFLEFLINVNSNFNSAIMASFLGEIDKAFQIVNYQWLMFYPCVYMFAMWDAFKDAEGESSPYSFFPFVFGAYFVTVGLMYSPIFKINGVQLGPIWTPMLSLIPGLLIGFIIWFILHRVKKYKNRI